MSNMLEVFLQIQTWELLVPLVTPLLLFLIGWRGLETWRRQLHGTDTYNLAYEVVVQTYRLRDAIACVRSPKVTRDEYLAIINFDDDFAPEPCEIHGEEVNEIDFDVWRRRIKQLESLAQDYELLAIRSEAVLGARYAMRMRTLLAQANKLPNEFEFLEHFGWFVEESGGSVDDSRATLLARCSNVECRQERSDEFSVSTNSAVQDIQQSLMKFLR